MRSPSFIPQLALLGALLLLAACDANDNQRDLRAALDAHLLAADQAQIQANTHIGMRSSWAIASTAHRV